MLKGENKMGLETESVPPESEDEEPKKKPRFNGSRPHDMTVEERLDRLETKVDQILAIAPTKTEKRLVIFFIATVVAAFVKHYTGIEIPIPFTGG